MMHVYVTRSHDGHVDCVRFPDVSEEYPIKRCDLEVEYQDILSKNKINLLEIVKQESEKVESETKWEAKTCTTEEDVAKYIEDSKGITQTLQLLYLPKMRALVKDAKIRFHCQAYCSFRGGQYDTLSIWIFGNELPDDLDSPLLQVVKKYNLAIHDCLVNPGRTYAMVYSAKDSIKLDITQYERDFNDPIIKALWSQIKE